MFKYPGIILLFILRWVLPICGLMVVVSVPVTYTYIDSVIKERVSAQLQTLFPELEISFQTTEFTPRQGLRIRGLRLKIPHRCFISPQNPNPNPSSAVTDNQIVFPTDENSINRSYDFLYIEELFLCSPFDWIDLVQEPFTISYIYTRGVNVYLFPVYKNKWNCQFVELPRQKAEISYPECKIENANIMVRDYRRSLIPAYHLREINVDFKHNTNDSRFHIQGTLSGDYTQRLEFGGQMDPSTGTISLTGTIKDCEISQRLFNSLPEEFLPKDEVSKNLMKTKVEKNINGLLSMNYAVKYDSLTKYFQYSASGRLVNARYEWAGLPNPLRDISSEFEIDNNGVRIKSFQANCGEGHLSVNYHQRSFLPNAPLELYAKMDKLILNSQFERIIPEKYKHIWTMIQPSGLINAEIRLSYDGKKWNPDISMDCQKGSLCFEGFPYEVTDLQGAINWKDQMLQVRINDSKNIAFGANFIFPPEGIKGAFRLRGTNIQINERLWNACPEAGRKVICDFDPKGFIDVDFGLDFPGEGKISDKQMSITIKDGACTYSRFPYPLQNVNGKIVMNNKLWTFDNFTAQNNTASVIAKGSVDLSDISNRLLQMSLTLKSVPIDKTFMHSMPQTNRQMFEKCGISGIFDANVSLAMDLGGHSTPKLSITAIPDNKTTTLCSEQFPYRLDKVGGTVRYENNTFTIDNFHSEHDQTRFSGLVSGKIIPNHGWSVNISNTSIDRLIFDRDFIESVPASLRRQVANLNLSGPIHFRGNVELNCQQNAATPLSGRWDGELGLHEVAFNKGISIRGICGGITTKGVFQNNTFYSEGELSIDSCMWDNIQLARLRGPYWVNNRQLNLGTGAQTVFNQMFSRFKNHLPYLNIGTQKRSLRASLFGGDIYTDAVVMFGDKTYFGLNTFIPNARLENCVILTRNPNLRGKLWLLGQVSGEAGNLASLNGKGDLRLSEADIYELPAMMTLLKLLSIREPDNNAFSNAEFAFRVGGKRLFFDRIDFRGDAISLYGIGDMDFNKRVNLSFYSLVGKSELPIPLVSDLFKTVSRQMLMIRMVGPIDNLKTWREIPMVNDSLRQIEAELSGERRPSPQTHRTSRMH